MAGQPLRPAPTGEVALVMAGRSVSPAIPHPAEDAEPELDFACTSGPALGGSGLAGRQPPITNRAPLCRAFAKTAGPPIRTTGPQDPTPHTIASLPQSPPRLLGCSLSTIRSRIPSPRNLANHETPSGVTVPRSTTLPASQAWLRD